MTELSPEVDKRLRTKWIVGDWLQVYSKSREQWFRAKIIEIYNDDDGEWLAVLVQDTMVKEVQRFADDVKPMEAQDDDDSDDNVEMSSDEEDSEDMHSDDSLSVSESDEDEKDKVERKRKKAAKKMSKHHELVVIFVERTGTAIFNGKYVYSTTTEEGYPIFEHVDNKHLLIKQNEEELRWELIQKKQVFYYADSDKEFPPSSGWSKTKLGDLPNPGVRLDSIKQQEAADDFFVDDPYKFSPFLILKYKFERVKNEPMGFDLQIISLHQKFVAVKSIKPDSQAENFGILPGDILVSANEVDLSKLKSVEAVSSAIQKLVKSLKDGADSTVSIVMAREKKTFKVLLCQRAGTKMVNAKYSIEGMENDALKFSNNDNKNLKILRIYVNEEEDESIWALREININGASDALGSKKKKKHHRKTMGDDSDDEEDDDDDEDDDDEEDDENHRDYYIVLASAKDEVPPECAWEAVDPHGLWPAAGLQYYDVKVVPPSKPRILRTQPNPNAVQIRFECDEAGRRPKVCPHMEVWYEIEMRHYKYNLEKGKTSKKPHDTKIWKTQESPFVANRLVNGDDYEFVVRTCNHIASTNSEASERVTPLQLPPKPKIIDITGKPGELYIHFHCANAKDREIQAKFEIIVDPPIDEEHQDYAIKEHRLLIDNDNKPVRLRNLINGTKYQIIVASVNSVGVTYSEPESAYPSKEPPTPALKKVEAGNREIIVHFDCAGYDKPDIRAWFEIELEPPPPSIEQAGILVRADGSLLRRSISGDDEKSDDVGALARQKSKMRVKLARKSRWRRQTMSQKLMTPGANFGAGGHVGGVMSPMGASGKAGLVTAMGISSVPNIASKPKIGLTPTDAVVEEEKAAQDNMAQLAEIESDDFVPYFRRSTRHHGTPIKISPVVNGISYAVRVKAATLSGSKLTQWSEQVTPHGPPPIPKVNKLTPLESSVRIEFVCNDYATEEYKATFDVESFPQTVTMKTIEASPYVFPKLNNGRAYKFHVRGVNKEGKSKWSEVSAPVTPLKIPPQPIDLRCVPFDREITVFWVCEELKTPEYSGWYEVESDPPTFTMVVTRSQARFRRLTNGKKYTFKVTAVNQVGKSESEQSEASVPDDDIAKEQYTRGKKSIAVQLKDKLLQIRKEQKKAAAHNKLDKLKATQQKHRQKDKKTNKELYNKTIAKQQKKQKAVEKAKKKEEKQRVEKKKQMDEQRQRVMQNKRRMSILAKDRITNLNHKVAATRGGGGNNMNTASAMMGRKKKAPKISANGKQSSNKKPKTDSMKGNKSNKKDKTTSSPAPPKQRISGIPLLSPDEINKLDSLREKDLKRASKKQNSVSSGSGSGSDSSPRKSKKKKQKGTKVESTVD
eukprot:CAMPEP_0202687728 /NCGR_PEP_ID=MMETSP1385-20130828/3367_1 /ASSEMBLY_ACC=CAM_ASM_000861 /TAXON_ID=933848 /ORGANISM="Elphidium margaritaceum" /LENGTH=1356 /DNA_ID=CAMNT_0049342569 /DNA_START=13 /DNA_END=4083 /DNA_ORIENTATION=+